MPRLEIAWTPVEDNLATAYNVYYRRKTDAAGGWMRLASGVVEPVYLNAATTYETTQIAVAPIVGGIEANEEDWSLTEYTPASLDDLTVPDDVANFSVGQLGNLIACRWDAVSPLPHHYEIRYGSTWNTAVVMQKPPGTATSASFGWGTTGAQTYLIRAVDATGQRSASSDSGALTVVQDSYEVTAATTDEHSGGYTGTKSGTEVSGGNLYLEKAPSLAQGWTDVANTYTWPPMFPHVSTGTYVTAAQDAGAVVEEKVDVALTFAAESASAVASDWSMIVRPAGNISAESRTTLDRIHAQESLVDGYEYDIEIDTTPDDPAGAPTWDGYRPWVPEATYRYRGVRLRITLISRWLEWVRLTAFTWKRKKLNRKDEKSVTVSAIGGTAVTWSTSFTSAPKVTASAVYAGWPLMVTVESVTTSGCDIRIWDAGGVERDAGTVYVLAMGT